MGVRPKGQKQRGVDIFGQPNQGKAWAGIQCKKKDVNSGQVLSNKEIDAEVKEARDFKPPLEQLIIATTASRDAKAQEHAREITESHRKVSLFSVTICAWQDMIDLISDCPEIQKKFLRRLLAALLFAQSNLITIMQNI